MSNLKPVFVHDCDSCRFLGSILNTEGDAIDLWAHEYPTHPATFRLSIIGRHSSEGVAYDSYPIGFARNLDIPWVRAALALLGEPAYAPSEVVASPTTPEGREALYTEADALDTIATVGPWIADPEHFTVQTAGPSGREHDHVLLIDGRTGEPDGPLCDVFGTGDSCAKDARFIARGRTLIPALAAAGRAEALDRQMAEQLLREIVASLPDASVRERIETFLRRNRS